MNKRAKEIQLQGTHGRASLNAGRWREGVAPKGTKAVPPQSESKKGKKDFGEKIDMFCHILPRKYNEALLRKAKSCFYLKSNSLRPALADLENRLRSMDNFEGLRQVLTISSPPLEYVVSAKDAVDLARLANDEMAELVNKYPDRFVAAVANLPMNDMDASLRETERAIQQLKFKGIQLGSSISGKPLDRPEFWGLYEKMAGYELPIWIHPVRDSNVPDYPDEGFSKFNLFVSFAWPYETTLAMARLVFGGIMEKYPNVKFIAHHCGAMLPFFSKRVIFAGPTAEEGEVTRLTHPPLEYFKAFYADTVLGGDTAALMCGYAFFGADHMLFGSDYPYPGDGGLADVIRSVELMNITAEEKAKIFSKTAKRILNLS
jgi:predicted TIM-barrel fold metal-dependent hydrolase